MTGKTKPIQVPNEMHAELKKLAGESNLPVGYYVRVILGNHIKAQAAPKQ
jgi:hypothetical protein